ncbi:DUF6077 domain-containing protein [Bauldia sp.]|uniref:DUF6077 domain-containing protein n=1 Tax=Bauldia sp. TaxID=2575872 RepID=UPI003BABE42A
MSFDMALGPITEPFRFAAYRIASYETAVAFVSEWTGLSLLPVYYLLVPAFTAVVSIGVTFLFARWFLPRGLAVAATAVFLLIMLAWGDSSITYGTRVFVRLFQGKGLIIALTVPLTIVTGLLLLRSPSIGKVVILSMVQVTTLGVSSSGLPIVFVTTAIVGVAALQPSIGRVLQLWLTLGATLIYPALALAWLTLGNESNVALSEIGSRRPINTALGFGLREALALITLLIGMAAVGERQTTREYRALVAGTLAFALNPWLAEFAASIASRNMSWRLAWASPVPLLMSVALVAAAGGLMWRTTSRRWIGPAAAACAAVILIVFIAAGRWTIAPGGRVAWKVHTAKLDAEYYAVERAMRKIEKLELDGSILAPSAIAAWIPVTAPGKHLVMPGRSYPSMYQTVMAPEEFAERRQLYRAINADQPDLEKQAVLLRKYDVGTIIIPRGIEAADLLPGAELDGLLMRTHPWKGPFDIVEIDWKEPEDR